MNGAKELRELTWDLSVLFVDDDEDIRRQLQALFGVLFHRVETAANGKEALALYNAHPKGGIDLIITDILMPQMNGLEMARRVRHADRDQKIIIVSAHYETDYFSEAIRIGVDGFVVKPVEPQQLFDALYKAAQSIRHCKENLNYQRRLEEMVEERVSEIEELLARDHLTGLGNRQRLVHDIAQAKNPALIMVDIDHFSEINDFYGHRIGDMVIVEFANRIFECLPETFRLYRCYADRFAVLAEGAEREQLSAFARRLGEELDREAILMAGKDFAFQATSALSFEPPENLYASAEMAIVRAKESRRNFLVYDAALGLEQVYENNILWVKRVAGALAQGRMTAYFQPILNLQNGRVEKYEALARMIDETGNIVPPAQFISAAKRSKQYLALTRTVFDQALALTRESEVMVSVNLTMEDLADDELFDYMLAQIAQGEPGRVALELVESERVEDYAKTAALFARAKAAGALIAIDDFGAGYSNFIYLLRLAVDYIKIDGSLITSLGSDPAALAVVETIVDFARKNNIRTIAEYVTDEALFERVKAAGIDFAQGYFIGHPAPHPMRVG